MLFFGEADINNGLHISTSFKEDDFLSQILYNQEYNISTHQKSTLLLDNSNLYNALVELAKLFNADLVFEYENNAVNFINRDKYRFKGYKLNPEFNLLTVSRQEKTEELATVLHLRGSNDLLSAVPKIPTEFQSYLYDCIANDFTGSNYFEIFEKDYDYVLGSTLYPAGEVHNFISAASYIQDPSNTRYFNAGNPLTPIKKLKWILLQKSQIKYLNLKIHYIV